MDETEGGFRGFPGDIWGFRWQLGVVNVLSRIQIEARFDRHPAAARKRAPRSFHLLSKLVTVNQSSIICCFNRYRQLVHAFPSIVEDSSLHPYFLGKPIASFDLAADARS
jgi:hypothetical protein